MLSRTCPLLLLGLLLCACGGETPGGGDDDAAVTIDAAVAIDASGTPDGPRACALWTRTDLAATKAPSSMDPVAVTTARTTRILVTGSIFSCDLPAMTVVTYDQDNRRAFAPISVFRPDPVCPTIPTPITRPIALRFPAQGTWTVYAGPDTSAPSITIVVGAPPDRACGVAGSCAMDCDCAGNGARCLGGYGFAGPFTQCARPCELDRDCAGAGTCESFDDGLELACQPGTAECGVDAPCWSGYDCVDGTCVATFTLDQSTRIPCSCDADCGEPLRCLEDADGGGARCELACPTDGAWCSGPHFCATFYQDVSGLAAVDGVCGWVGE